MNFFGNAPINPFIFFTGKIAGYVVWTFYLMFLFDVRHIFRYSFGWNDIAGNILFFTGLLIAGISLFNLGRSTRFGLPIENTFFATKGIYQFSRNPMYLGFDLMTLGAMLYILKYDMILLGIYSIFTYHKIILAEEKFLTERFGQKYREFRNEVRRYL